MTSVSILYIVLLYFAKQLKTTTFELDLFKFYILGYIIAIFLLVDNRSDLDSFEYNEEHKLSEIQASVTYASIKPSLFFLLGKSSGNAVDFLNHCMGQTIFFFK